jgi:ribulose-phosphate 3-epimerase
LDSEWVVRYNLDSLGERGWGVNQVEIVPSILSADFANLERDVRAVAGGGARYVQIDVMDGRFVPNITVGAPVVKALRQATEIGLDVHLMIQEPERFIDDFVKAGADILTVHVEATLHPHRALQRIREAGIKVGIALNPGTPAVAVQDLVDLVDLVLVMTVNPGFGGQKFIPSMLRKIRQLRSMLDERGYQNVAIEVDGGIDPQTAPQVAAAGARMLVAGSSVYSAGVGVAEAIARLEQCALGALAV